MRRLSPALAALVVLGPAILVAHLVHDNHVETREQALDSAADRLQQRVEAHEVILRAIKGLLRAEGRIVTRDQLAVFLETLPSNAAVDSSQGFGFALATPTAAPEVAQRVAAQSYPEPRAPWPETDQRRRFPIVLLEPQTGNNSRAIGFDMYAEATRRDAMQRAAASRRVAVSAPVHLVQSDQESGPWGVLFYLPIFVGEGVATPAGAGDGELLGFVYAPVRVGDMIRKVLSVAAFTNVRVTATDAGAPDSGPMVSAGTPRIGALSITRNITVADRLWRVDLTEENPPGQLQDPAFYVLVFGAIGALLLSYLTTAHFREVDISEKLAVESAARAETTEVLLGEMQHRIKNSIARKLALFRISARETSDRETLMELFEQRMLALARAQDALTAGKEAGLTIRQLLIEEIGAWGNENSGVALNGPDIMLDSQQAQALALIAHELITNSLKYGALANGRQLQIQWRLLPENGRDHVVVNWDEEIPEHAGSTNEAGFGSRLIRLMAEGQLGGAAHRTLSARKLHLRLRFPLAPIAQVRPQA